MSDKVSWMTDGKEFSAATLEDVQRISKGQSHWSHTLMVTIDEADVFRDVVEHLKKKAQENEELVMEMGMGKVEFIGIDKRVACIERLVVREWQDLMADLKGDV